MKEIIFHIGWPKSGTSSIQGLLAHNSDHLYQFGFLYPKIERLGNAHHTACGLFINHHDPLIPPPTNDLGYLFDYLDAPEHRHIHTVILSSEGFCRADSIKNELSLLKEKADVRVIACLRDPLIWANSLINQLVKMRLFFSSELDLEALAEKMILRDFNYPIRLRLWSEHVGRENIKTIALEEGKDFAKYFLDSVGIGDQMLPNAPPRNTENKSLSLGSLQLIHWIFRQNIALEHSRKVVLNQRLHESSEREIPNLLNQKISKQIRSQRSQIIEELSRHWLDGKQWVVAERELPVFSDFGKLDCPYIKELAENVLGDDPELLSELRDQL